MIPFLHRVIVLQYVLDIALAVGKMLIVLNDDVIISNDSLFHRVIVLQHV